MARIVNVDVDPVLKTITYKYPPWPHFWLEVCRGHEVKRPWFLRWLWAKRRFHDRPHRRSDAFTAQAIYSFLVEEWGAVEGGSSA